MTFTLGVRLEEPVGAGGAPRVCGDDPINSAADDDLATCSPRMRG